MGAALQAGRAWCVAEGHTVGRLFRVEPGGLSGTVREELKPRREA